MLQRRCLDSEETFRKVVLQRSIKEVDYLDALQHRIVKMC